MPSFHEVRFPTSISFHSTGGPSRKTEIVTLGSGFEERNAVWANSRRNYDVGYGVKSLDDIHAVIAFFEARNGQLYGFRLKDFSDWKSCAPGVALSPSDQACLNTVTGNTTTGDGSTTTFQLQKTYSDIGSSYTRTVKKPVSGTVRVAKAGVEQMSGWSVDTTTGIITFTSAPADGAAITAGFEFDVPVRFNTDSISINLSSFEAGELTSIPIVEIRL
jgi:uncharacterized protein (TIGR02217 family)